MKPRIGLITRSAGMAAAATVLAAASTAGCGRMGATSARPLAVRREAVVPFAAIPAPPAPAPPPVVTPSYPPATARACQATDLRVSPAGDNGATGHLLTLVDFVNVSGHTCLLAGYPTVIATSPEWPAAQARRGGYMTADSQPPAADMAPGQRSELGLETSTHCITGPNQQREYSTIAVAIPGGGVISRTLNLDLVCGLYETHFYFLVPPHPPPSPAPTPPIALLRLQLRVPASAVAGMTMTYTVALTNPTRSGISLSPCPVYTQRLVGGRVSVSQTMLLNCSAAPRVVPAGGSVIFEMRLPIPARTPANTLAAVFWELGYATPAGGVLLPGDKVAVEIHGS